MAMDQTMKASVNGDMDAAGPVHLFEIAVGYEVAHVGVGAAAGVADEAPDFGRAAAQVEKVHEELDKVGGALDLDFGVAADEVGVGMVAGVAPAPHVCLANAEEGGDGVDKLV